MKIARHQQSRGDKMKLEPPQLVETELKIALDPAQEARLRRHPGLMEWRVGKRRTRNLVTIYYDTPDHDLSAAGVALRLRKTGRNWVQTIKMGKGGGHGLFSRAEIDMPAPGGRLVLDGPDPDGVLAEIGRIVGGGALSPVFETRIRRVTDRLKLEDGGEVELAFDEGEVVAGEASRPIHEAEIELLCGEVGAVFDVAERLFTEGPIRFARESKAARGYRVARGEATPAMQPRNAGSLAFEADATIEGVAGEVLRDCFAQIAANMEVIADSNDIEGPHQLRVGLRRVRTAFSVFGKALGTEAFADLSGRARDLGRVVGKLRDLDVLIEELVAARAIGLDEAARAALIGVLEARRAAVRDEVRKALAAPESVAFLFEMGRMIEGRGWLVSSDYAQSARLAAPVLEVAGGLLRKRHKGVLKAGHDIRSHDAEALHNLRKELKKLRYTADMFGSIYPAKKVKRYVRSLKALQDRFGSLNDAAMAAALLTGEDAPGAGDAQAQRAVGWILGTLSVEIRDDRPKLFEGWDEFAAQKPFWA